MMKRKPLTLCAGIVVLAMIGKGALWAKTQWSISSLTTPRGFVDGPGHPHTPATAKRWRKFDALWLVRTKKEVVRPLLPYLTDSFPRLREQAVKRLGRLENPQAEKPLRVLLNRTERAKDIEGTRDQSIIALQVALGRIRARNLKGKAKVSAVVKEVGLTWPSVVTLSRRLMALQPGQRSETLGDGVMDGVIELLCDMADRGEDITPFAKQLKLSPGQQALLQNAQWSTPQEVRMLIRFLSKYPVLMESERISNRLMDLRPQSTEIVIGRLRDIHAHPERYRKTSVEEISTLMWTAARMDDPRVLPLLKKFEANLRPWPGLREEAQKAEFSDLRTREKLRPR